jgi:hypothetical protein
MQNRGMFLYRRHGPRKRPKPGHAGQAGHAGQGRKPRGPQKGLPNSARDLLPLLQPATKALAQMLAGRTGVSGQLGHARAMLAQAERLIAERAHNRLNPAEREEFFEQLARLKLTLADAEDEAEIRAAEDETPAPPAPPVAQERLKELALALSAPAPQGPAERAAPADQEPAEPEAVDRGAAPAPDLERSSEALTSAANRRAGRLELPRSIAGQSAPAIDPSGTPSRPRRLRQTVAPAPASGSPASGTPAFGSPASGKDEQRAEPRERSDEGAAGNGADEEGKPKPPPRTAVRRPRKAKTQGVPEGWVIDDEGFVVPGPD